MARYHTRTFSMLIFVRNKFLSIEKNQSRIDPIERILTIQGGTLCAFQNRGGAERHGGVLWKMRISNAGFT
jgi:hypothetical protein